MTVAPRTKSWLTDTALKALKPQAKAYKVTDGKCMHVMISPSGTKTFRLDFRLAGVDGKTTRETLTIGRYEAGTVAYCSKLVLGCDTSTRAHTGSYP